METVETVNAADVETKGSRSRSRFLPSVRIRPIRLRGLKTLFHSTAIQNNPHGPYRRAIACDTLALQCRNECGAARNSPVHIQVPHLISSLYFSDEHPTTTELEMNTRSNSVGKYQTSSETVVLEGCCIGCNRRSLGYVDAYTTLYLPTGNVAATGGHFRNCHWVTSLRFADWCNQLLF